MDNKNFLRKIISLRGKNLARTNECLSDNENYEYEMNYIDILRLYNTMNLSNDRKNKLVERIELSKKKNDFELNKDEFVQVEIVYDKENTYYYEILSKEVYKVCYLDDNETVEGECMGIIYESFDEDDYLMILNGKKYLILDKAEDNKLDDKLKDVYFDIIRKRLYKLEEIENNIVPKQYGRYRIKDELVHIIF